MKLVFLTLVLVIVFACSVIFCTLLHKCGPTSDDLGSVFPPTLSDGSLWIPCVIEVMVHLFVMSQGHSLLLFWLRIILD